MNILKKNFQTNWPITNKLKIEFAAIFIFIFLYTTAAILISLNRYWVFNSFWADFGQLDTTIWKLSRFQIPIIFEKIPPFAGNIWGFHCHFNPSVAFLAPLYWITDKQEIIIIAQAVFVGLSAIIAYIISLKVVKISLVRIYLIVSYLGYVGLQNALESDVHVVVFAVLPLMLVIWAIFEKRWKIYWLFLLITIGFQENMALVAIGLGIFLILRKQKEIKIGILTIIIGFIYGLLTIYVFMPYLNGGPYPYFPEIPSVWHEWLIKIFSPFELKSKAIVVTFINFGLLPILSRSALPLIFSQYIERFVFGKEFIRWSLDFHYNAILSPIMYLALTDVLINIQKKIKFRKILTYWSIISIVIVVIMHFQLKGAFTLLGDIFMYDQSEKSRSYDHFINQIPKKGLIMTQNNVATRFAHENIILLSNSFETILADTIAVKIDETAIDNDFYPLKKAEIDKFIEHVTKSKNYQLLRSENKEFIFVRK